MREEEEEKEEEGRFPPFLEFPPPEEVEEEGTPLPEEVEEGWVENMGFPPLPTNVNPSESVFGVPFPPAGRVEEFLLFLWFGLLFRLF